MPFVVDASVTACWLMPDEVHPLATVAYDAIAVDYAIVPWLWWYEVRNLLVVNERRGRLDADRSDRALSILRRHPIEFDRTPDEVTVLALTRRHRLTVYDAAYLEVAQRFAIPLATLDAALVLAARSEKVPLLGAA